MGDPFPHGRSRTRRFAGRKPRRYRPTKQESFITQVAGLSFVVAVATFTLAPDLERTWSVIRMSPEDLAAVEGSAHYQNCDHARAASAAPIHRGEPGYRLEMDGDSDGIACEPYRGGYLAVDS